MSVFDTELGLLADFIIPLECPIMHHAMYKKQDILIIAKCINKNGAVVINSYVYGISRSSSIYKKLVLIHSVLSKRNFSEI